MGGIKHTNIWRSPLVDFLLPSLSLALVTMAPSLGCAIEAHLQQAVALHSRRDRGAGGLIVHRMCTKTRGATLGVLKCREPELLHDEEGAKGDLRGAS